MIKPKKHLGQHFLTDRSIASRIANALNTRACPTVVEIGPGKGILTACLLEKEVDLHAVEIDPESVDFLAAKWPQLKNSLIMGDFLKLDLDMRIGKPFHVIGNLPYHISSQILFRILDYRQMVPSVVCMLQKEVADRIASPPGSRQYGILSVLLQAYYDIEYLFTVKPGSFFPPPKVTSGVLRLTRNRIHRLPCDEKLFFRLVKTLFNQRRKMIRNSIRAILVHLEDGSPYLDMRPEQLDVNEFVELTRWAEPRIRAGTEDPPS